MQPQIDDPIAVAERSSEHTAASVSVLDTLARRLALVTALMSPLLPLTSAPYYLYADFSSLYVHLPVVVLAVAMGLYRSRLSAQQIAFGFAALMSAIVFNNVYRHGLVTPLTPLLGFAITALAIFTNKRCTIIGGVLLFGIAFVLTLWLRLNQGGGEFSSLTGRDWSELAAWVGLGFFWTMLSVMVLCSLVGALEVANQAERKQREHRWLAERGAQQSDDQLRLILDNAPVGITVLDEKGDIRGWNRVNEESLGVTSDQMLGSSFTDYLSRADQNHPLIPKLEAMYRGKPFYNLLLEIASTNGVVTNIMMSGRPVFDEAGRVSGGVLIGAEVSSLIRVQGDLATDSATEEVSRLAHDIRSPLMALGLSMEALEIMLSAEEPDLDRIRSKLPVILQQQTHAAEVVEGYYDALRQRAQNETMQDPVRLTEAAADVLRASFKTQHVDIEIDAGLALDTKVLTQPVLVRQIIINLLTNSRDAIVSHRGRDATDGRVRLRVEATPEAVQWTVEDNGGGVLPEDTDIFFSRGFTTKPVGEGTGMGLFISRATAEHLGGSLTVSQGENGLIFSLSLPRTSGDD